MLQANQFGTPGSGRVTSSKWGPAMSFFFRSCGKFRISLRDHGFIQLLLARSLSALVSITWIRILNNLLGTEFLDMSLMSHEHHFVHHSESLEAKLKYLSPRIWWENCLKVIYKERMMRKHLWKEKLASQDCNFWQRVAVKASESRISARNMGFGTS